MCKYVFCVVVILECPSLLATLAIDTPANNNIDAWVCQNHGTQFLIFIALFLDFLR